MRVIEPAAVAVVVTLGSVSTNTLTSGLHLINPFASTVPFTMPPVRAEADMVEAGTSAETAMAPAAMAEERAAEGETASGRRGPCRCTGGGIDAGGPAVASLDVAN